MLRRILGFRGFPAIVVIVVLAVGTVVGFRLSKPTPAVRGYCALMPDAIGLYKGSAVTVMGISVGRVTAVIPDGDAARVEFDVRADRRLPADVGATTLSNTLVADRNLALIGAEPTAGGWDSGRCITKTATPKSLTRTFTALADLAQQLNGPGDPQHPNLIEGGLQALNSTTAGTGDQINRIVHGLGAALNSPDSAIGHIGALLDALAELSRSAANGWVDVKPMVTRLAQTLNDINNVAAPPLIGILDELKDVLPEVNDLTVMFGGPALRGLDSIPDLPQLISSGVGTLRKVIEMVPPLAGAFTGAVGPATDRVSLAYAPPRVALPEHDVAQICSALNALSAGACPDTGNGMAAVPLAQLVLAAVGAR